MIRKYLTLLLTTITLLATIAHATPITYTFEGTKLKSYPADWRGPEWPGLEGSGIPFLGTLSYDPTAALSQSSHGNLGLYTAQVSMYIADYYFYSPPNLVVSMGADYVKFLGPTAQVFNPFEPNLAVSIDDVIVWFKGYDTQGMDFKDINLDLFPEKSISWIGRGGLDLVTHEGFRPTDPGGNFTFVSVPEPGSTAMLLGMAIAILGFVRRKHSSEVGFVNIHSDVPSMRQ